MNRLKDDSLLDEFQLLRKAYRHLAGFIGEGFGNFEYQFGLVRRKAGCECGESGCEVGLNKHFMSPVRGGIAMPVSKHVGIDLSPANYAIRAVA